MVDKPGMFYDTPRTSEVDDPAVASLEKKVADALAIAGGLDASDISVTAIGSVIVLEGSVLQDGEIGRAYDIARSIPGVTGVESRLRAAGLDSIIDGHKH